MKLLIYVDRQCGYNFENKIELYNKNLENNLKTKLKSKLIIVFSNNFEYVKGICKIYPKPSIVINITENLSEYHMANSLKYVKDVYYLKSGVEVVCKRIINMCNRLELKEENL